MREVAIPGVEQYVRQLQQAQVLQNTASLEGGMVGRYFVAPSVTQRLAAALKRMKGDEMESQAQAGIDAARKQQLEAMQYALTGQRPQAPLKRNQDGGFVAAQRPTTQAEVDASFDARQAANREQMGIAQSYPVQAPSVQQAPANPVMAERQAMIQRMIASGNPELVRQAAQMMMADQEYMRTRADTRADTLDQRQYQTGRDETQFGRQVQLAGMQNDWQNQRQEGQQAFTAEQNALNRGLTQRQMDAQAADRAEQRRRQEEADQRAREAADRAQWTYDEQRGVAINKITGETRPIMGQNGQPLGPQLAESQLQQIRGLDSTIEAGNSFIRDMQGLGNTDMMDMNTRSKVGTAYTNLMLQAKDAYRLGVLAGEDLKLMETLVNNPLDWQFMARNPQVAVQQTRQLQELLMKTRNILAQGGTPTAPQLYQPEAPRSDIPPTQVPQMQAPPKVLRFDANGNMVQ